jgi:hypothetical protein
LLNNPSGLNSNPSGRIFDAKSDKISTFFKKSGSEMTTYYILWARTRKQTKKKRPCEERTTNTGSYFEIRVPF